MKITARLYVPTQNENWTTVQWELTAYSTLKKIQKNARKIIMEIYYFYAGDFPISKIDIYDEDLRLLIDTKPFEVDLRCHSLNSPEPNYRGENSNGETEHLTLTKKRVKLKAIIQGDICKVYIAGWSDGRGGFRKDFNITRFENGESIEPDLIADWFGTELSLFLSEQNLEATNSLEIIDKVFDHLCPGWIAFALKEGLR